MMPDAGNRMISNNSSNFRGIDHEVRNLEAHIPFTFPKSDGGRFYRPCPLPLLSTCSSALLLVHVLIRALIGEKRLIQALSDEKRQKTCQKPKKRVSLKFRQDQVA
jgi:hypothetical protein